MAGRLALGDYDHLHHFVAAGIWDATPSSSIAASQPQGEKKESPGHRPNRLCPPCATPSSNSSLDHRRSDARIVKNGFATSAG
jgi:hypothetical protein